MELVAELGRPLREDIPLAISNSISAAMAPLLDQVGKAGAEGVGSLVQDLSARFSDDVGKALGQASDKLAQAGERIGALSERMDASSGRMGGEMDAAVARVAQAVDDLRSTMTAAADATGGAFSQGADRMLSIMNETLQGIRENTGEGARAMSAAAADLKQAGTAFKEQMESASLSGSAAARERIEASGSEIARLTGELTSKASEQLLAPLGEIARQMDGLAGQVAGASSDMRMLSEGVRSGAEASVQAASTFRTASQDLVTAAAPIRATSERIEGSIRQLADSTQNVATTVSRSAEATASSALDALNAAKQILSSEARAIEAGLEGVTAMLERLKGQGDRLDDMDSKLGRAFEVYTTQVASAVDSMRGHVSELQGRLNPALDVMQAIVDQAEQFARTINADFRIGLTGTPIENSAQDLWAIMDQLTPGSLDSLGEFRRTYADPTPQNMAQLHSRVFLPIGEVPPLALRRLKQTVASDLPTKSRYLHPLAMPRQQAESYEDAKLKLAQGGPGAALKMLHHIRSVSVHPDPGAVAPNDDMIALSARLMATFGILRTIRQKQERALVFIEHRQMQYRFIELIKAEFEMARVDLINGDTPIKKRQDIVNRFQMYRDAPAFDLLVLGPKAAGTGLTLTAATHVIHLSRWWNPAVEEQCNDRIHRIGQTRPVSVHVPMSIHPGFREHSFDCLLHSLMQRKRRLASSALWPMGDTEADAGELQRMVADGVAVSGGDAVLSAMAAMFERDDIPMPPRKPDGSIPFE